MAKYVPPSKRAGYVPSAAPSLPPDPRGTRVNRSVGTEAWHAHELSAHFTHTQNSTLTFFSYYTPYQRIVRPPYNPSATPYNTPLPPSPPPPAPEHPLNHLISYIVLFPNAHPDWDSSRELWIHTSAEKMMDDYGWGQTGSEVREGFGPKKNFGRPIPVFKPPVAAAQSFFVGWFQIDRMRVVPPGSDEVADLLHRKESAKSYKSGRTPAAWNHALSDQWVKLRLSPSPPSTEQYESLEHPMKVKGGKDGEIQQYMLRVGGLMGELGQLATGDVPGITV